MQTQPRGIDYRETIHAQLDELVALRRELHRHPEPSLKEFETTDRICRELDSAGIAYRRMDPTGVVGDLKGSRSSNTHMVLLRSDMDALEIFERTGLDFQSETPGVMHACGHDCHTAMLLGAARALWGMREELQGTVKLIFQMGEEIGRKSEEYVKRGALEGVDAIFGMHVWPSMLTGTFNFEDGERMACSDRFTTRESSGLFCRLGMLCSAITAAAAASTASCPRCGAEP